MKNSNRPAAIRLAGRFFLRFSGSSPNKKTCFCKQAFLFGGYVNYR
ncbi:hypothetical protein D932_00639 [Enterococcus casseliflavus 14-MB-W-14]|nr:hypothetical protein D932_00639 [Enterococcus casseliflavus 14-MB-W-14]